jgi:uncharacterized protein HemX
LQLEVLALKQALLSRNQKLWESSLNQVQQLTQKFFIQDQVQHQVLSNINSLSQVKIEGNTATLEQTMAALTKLQQLFPEN